MNQTVIFGGESNKWSSYDFEGGTLTSICGGMEVDLTDCYLSRETDVINLNIICGGITLILPKEWNVMIEIVPVLGSIEDQIMDINTYTDPAAAITLKGKIIMGSLEIKRV